MKKTFLLILLLAALGGVAYWKKNSNERRANSVKLVGAADREYLVPDLRAKLNDSRKLRITDGDKKVTVAIAGDKWVVEDRDGYPASFEKLQKFLVQIADLKVGKKGMLGKSALGDVKLELPTGKADDKKGGLQIELLDEKDAAIASILLGANRDSTTVGKQPEMFGGGSTERVARVLNGADGDTVWWINDAMYEASAKAEDWVDKSFIDVQKIKAVEITSTKAEESWKASRAKDDGEFAFDGAPAGEVLDEGKASLASLLSSASFTDVLTKATAKPDLMKDAWKAKITTFDGFTYNLLTKKSGTGSDEKYYLSVAATGDFPTARVPGKDEKPEDKKKLDEEFAAKKKEMEDKLAKVKSLEGRVFEVSSYTVTSLLKPRKDVLKDPPAAPEKPEGGPAVPKLEIPGGIPPAPPKPTSSTPPPTPATTAPITVTTPPVAVPPMPKTEIAPTPPPDANPATGKPDPKPAPATPPPATPPPATPPPAPATPPAK
jgi:hypothetical protein